MRRTTKAALISLAANTGLIGAKIALATLSGSYALKADALHSASDLIVSLVVLLSVWLSGKSKSRIVRILDIGISLAISIIIIGTAYVFIRSGNAGSAHTIEYPLITLAGVLLCIYATDILARYKIRVGKEESVQSLLADGYHSRMDMLSSAAVFAAIFSQWRGIDADIVVAFVVAVMIGLLGIELLISTLKVALTNEDLAMARNSVLTWLSSALPAPFKRKIASKIAVATAIAVLAAWIASSVYVVYPGQEGIRLRMGKIQQSNLGPGTYFALWPIYKFVKANTGLVDSTEIGYRLKSNANGTEIVPVVDESFSLTGDSNIADVWLVIHFKIRDINKALFACQNPKEQLKAAANTQMRIALASAEIDTLLTTGRSQLQQDILEGTQRTMNRLGCGIEILSAMIRSTRPPLAVVKSFRDVFSAQEDMQTKVNKAQATANDKLPKAHGKAHVIQQQAQAYAIETIANTKAEILKTAPSIQAFQITPNSTMFRMRIEAWEESLIDKPKYIVSSAIRKALWYMTDSKTSTNSKEPETNPANTSGATGSTGR